MSYTNFAHTYMHTLMKQYVYLLNEARHNFMIVSSSVDIFLPYFYLHLLYIYYNCTYIYYNYIYLI